MPFISRGLPLIGILMLLVSAAQAQDAYHTNLLSQLESDYGLTGGEWVLPNTEAGTMGKVWGNTPQESFTVAGEAFTQAIRLRIGNRGVNPWDFNMGINPDKALITGDRALLVVWVRGVAAERASGLITVKYEKNSSPWTASAEEGIVPSMEWQQWFIPFEASILHPFNEAQLIFHLGIMAQEVELGGIAILNYGKTVQLSDLPTSEHNHDYDGRDLNAAWRTEAAARIDTHRKRDMAISVVDNRGKEVEGATVQVRMKQHHFGFGSAIAVWQFVQQSGDGQIYRNKLADLNGEGKTFNTSVLENALKWGPWENPSWPANQSETVKAIADLKALGMTVRGHNLVWPAWDWMPDDIRQYENDPAALRQVIEDRIERVANHPGIKGELIDWDVLNEPAHLMEIAHVFANEPGYTTGEEIYADWFKQAAAIDPDASLFINEYSILSSTGLDLATQERYQRIIDLIEAEGAVIDGIGMQGHMGLPFTTPETVYEIIDEFAASGKQISITEYDASGIDEALAADYMRDFLTITYSHPSVVSFLMWGFWDGAHWKDDAPIFRQDWSLKPSGQAFFDLVFDAWWTDEQGATDANGEYNVRGFHGEYEVIVTYENDVLEQDVRLDPSSDPLALKFFLPSQVDTQNPIRTGDFRLEPAHPNPSTNRAVLSYHLPQSATVEIALFDVLGREVSRKMEGPLTQGMHRSTIETAFLPAGVYFYHVQANEERGTGRLVIR